MATPQSTIEKNCYYKPISYAWKKTQEHLLKNEYKLGFQFAYITTKLVFECGGNEAGADEFFDNLRKYQQKIHPCHLSLKHAQILHATILSLGDMQNNDECRKHYILKGLDQYTLTSCLSLVSFAVLAKTNKGEQNLFDLPEDKNHTDKAQKIAHSILAYIQLNPIITVQDLWKTYLSKHKINAIRLNNINDALLNYIDFTHSTRRSLQQKINRLQGIFHLIRQQSGTGTLLKLIYDDINKHQIEQTQQQINFYFINAFNKKESWHTNFHLSPTIQELAFDLINSIRELLIGIQDPKIPGAYNKKYMPIVLKLEELFGNMIFNDSDTPRSSQSLNDSIKSKSAMSIIYHLSIKELHTYDYRCHFISALNTLTSFLLASNMTNPQEAVAFYKTICFAKRCLHQIYFFLETLSTNNRTIFLQQKLEYAAALQKGKYWLKNIYTEIPCQIDHFFQTLSLLTDNTDAIQIEALDLNKKHQIIKNIYHLPLKKISSKSGSVQILIVNLINEFIETLDNILVSTVQMKFNNKNPRCMASFLLSQSIQYSKLQCIALRSLISNIDSLTSKMYDIKREACVTFNMSKKLELQQYFSMWREATSTTSRKKSGHAKIAARPLDHGLSQRNRLSPSPSNTD